MLRSKHFTLSISMDKSKAAWDRVITEIFIKECLQQVYQKERKGSSFTKVGWKKIETAFKAKSRKPYDRKQLKNKYDSLRKDWFKWEGLCKETGVGWDPTTNTVVASDEWWEKKKKENREYEKFKYNRLPFAKELQIILKGTSASGEDQLAPSSTPQEDEDQEDVYRPDMDLLEGSGDSEEDLADGSAGFTYELAGVNLTSSTRGNGPSDSGSHGKRKRNEGCGKGKKVKIASLKQIADSVSVIAAASKDRATALKEMNDISISEVTAELLRMEEIRNDDDLLTQCLDYVVNKNWRELFMALKEDHGVLMDWVRRMAHNPPTWLQPQPS